MVIPLVLAAETAYLGFIGTHPRFQRHVDAQEHKAARAQANAEAVERLKRRFPCAAPSLSSSQGPLHLGLRQIAEQMREPDGADSLRSLDELQLSDLDRLLWMYLRMLYTQHMLERFFESTSGDQIQTEISRLEDRIRRLEKEPESRQPGADPAIAPGQPRNRPIAARQSRKGAGEPRIASGRDREPGNEDPVDHRTGDQPQ